MKLTQKDFEEAKKRVHSLIPPSPVKESIYLRNQKNAKKVLLKLESLNVSGSFKIRGAANTLLQMSKKDLKDGVVCASAGNHAQGVAFVAKMLNIQSHIFLPVRTPLIKEATTKAFGANVYRHGENYDEAHEAATAFKKKNGGVFIHPFDDWNVIKGQGTIGLELLEQCEDISTIFIPIGGGGLISGISSALKMLNPKIKIFGVQTETYPYAHDQFYKIKNRVKKNQPSLADGIAVKKPGEKTMGLIHQHVDEILLVSEDDVAAAIMRLGERDHIIAEGAGAAAVAGFMSLEDKYYANLKGSVVCIISGGNIDMNLLNRMTNRGLLHSGRLMLFSTIIKDQPGNMSKLLNAIGQQGANLLDVRHNRVFANLEFDEVSVEVELETFDHHHQKRIFDALQNCGYRVQLKSVV